MCGWVYPFLWLLLHPIAVIPLLWTKQAISSLMETGWERNASSPVVQTSESKLKVKSTKIGGRKDGKGRRSEITNK